MSLSSPVCWLSEEENKPESELSVSVTCKPQNQVKHTSITSLQSTQFLLGLCVGDLCAYCQKIIGNSAAAVMMCLPKDKLLSSLRNV